jgi:hypothetical protein
LPEISLSRPKRSFSQKEASPPKKLQRERSVTTTQKASSHKRSDTPQKELHAEKRLHPTKEKEKKQTKTKKKTSSRPKRRTALPSVAQWRDPCISPLPLPVLAVRPD